MKAHPNPSFAPASTLDTLALDTLVTLRRYPTMRGAAYLTRLARERDSALPQDILARINADGDPVLGYLVNQAMLVAEAA